MVSGAESLIQHFSPPSAIFLFLVDYAIKRKHYVDLKQKPKGQLVLADLYFFMKRVSFLLFGPEANEDLNSA